MKLLVNGQEWSPRTSDASVERTSDRLVVRSKDGAHTALVVRSGAATYVSYRGRTYKIERAVRRRAGEADASGELRAPMPGMIVEVSCSKGQSVQSGDRLMVLEAMKMQQPIVSPIAGTVKAVRARQGEQVVEGHVLVVVEAE